MMTETKQNLAEWKKKNRLAIQVIIFVLSLILPFVIYFSLENNHYPAAVIAFAIQMLCMLVLVWL